MNVTAHLHDTARNDERAIVAAALRHAAESARAQGLPATVTDPDVLRQVAAIIQPAPPRSAAA